MVMESLLIRYELIFFFLGGLIVGSFLNTVIYRLPLIMGYEEKDVSFIKFNLAFPASHCPNCESKLPFYLNIPLLSFIWLRGRCSFCKDKISTQYPFIELVTGILFSWIAFNSIDLQQSTFLCIFFSALLVLSVIDSKFQLVPSSISFSLIIIALLYNFLVNPDLVKDAILGALSGYLFFFLIEKLFKYLKGIEGLGRGDAKVFSSMGALMGWQYLPYILLASSLLGLISVLIFFIIKKKSFKELKGYSIPFVPALSFGLLINLF